VPLAYLIAEAVWLPRETWRRGVAAGAICAASICVGAVASAHFYQPKSMHELAARLRAARQPGEPVIFLGNYHYDIAFYAQLNEPAIVVDSWKPEEIARDSWRRELVDAQSFAAADAPPRLLKPDAVANVVCGAPIVWLIGNWPPANEPHWLAQQLPAFQAGSSALWRLDSKSPSLRAELICGSQTDGFASAGERFKRDPRR
jgi:hypothetical protein